MSLPFADAFHFRRVQAEDPQIGPFRRAIDGAQVVVLGMNAAGQHERRCEDPLQSWAVRNLAGHIADDAAEIGFQRPEGSLRPLELLGMGIALLPDEGACGDPRISLTRRDAMLL